MTRFTLTDDIITFYVTASSYPEGIAGAHAQLRRLLPSTEGRRFFGISYPHPDGNGEIIYHAAVEETYPQEGKALDCKSFVIQKAIFIYLDVKNYQSNPTAIGAAFETLLTQPEIDPKGYCLELYSGEYDVRCAVPLQKGKSWQKE